jgi:hypothetical protein
VLDLLKRIVRDDVLIGDLEEVYRQRQSTWWLWREVIVAVWMEGATMKRTDLRLLLAVLAGWALILPATALLGMNMVRLSGGRGIVFQLAAAFLQRTAARIPVAGAAIIFLALPAGAILVGATTLIRHWRTDVTLRDDVLTAFQLLRRNVAITMLAVGTLLGGTLFAAVVVHIFTD